MANWRETQVEKKSELIKQCNQYEHIIPSMTFTWRAFVGDTVCLCCNSLCFFVSLKLFGRVVMVQGMKYLSWP